MSLTIDIMGSRFYVTPNDARNVSQAVYCAFSMGEAQWVKWIIESGLPYEEDKAIQTFKLNRNNSK